MAMTALMKHGYDVRLVNPYKETIDGHKCFRTVTAIKKKINTVSLYVNPYRFRDHIEEVIQLKPERVVMNPGTEDADIKKILKDAGVKVFRAFIIGSVLSLKGSGSFNCKI